MFIKSEVWKGQHQTPGFLSNILTTLISLILMQLGHFLGFFNQMLKSQFKGHKTW